MLSESQINSFFVSWKSYVLLWRYQGYFFFTISWCTESVMSINALDKVHFSIYLLRHDSLTHQTWLIDSYQQGQYFSEIFWMIWRTGAKFQAFFNLATCCNCSITNIIKNGKYQLINIDRSHYIVISLKS